MPSPGSVTWNMEVDTTTSTLPASPVKLEEIRQCTDQDIVLAHLKDVVHHGWPEYPTECPQDLKEYWNFREDLSAENGPPLKGHRLIIPSSLRPQMLNSYTRDTGKWRSVS